MQTATVARTVVCPLQTSQRKVEYVREAVEQYQDVLSTMADYMVSINSYDWEAQNTTVSHVTKQQCKPDTLYAHDRNDAGYKVAEAFDSKVSNDHSGEYPSFGGDSYIRCCSCCTGLGDRNRVLLATNDRGYGLRCRIQKGHGDEWFHVGGGPYQYDQLDEIVDGSASLGNVELHVGDNSLFAHISYSHEVEVPDAANTPRYVGVDLGERTLYALAVLEREDTVTGVRVNSGAEQRHHRDRLSARQERRQRSGHRRRASGVSDRRQYTEHVMDRASREIVDHAAEYAPCTLVIEDLTGYREDAPDPIHDWPFGELQQKLCYKAEAAKIPVEVVDPAYTSQTCRRCDASNPTFRDGPHFSCGNCGYEVHADVNAAINLARRGRIEARSKS